MLRLDDVYAFGLLAMSCSPGGGGSNTWAYLLGGDLDLSITMTFFSTLFSLGEYGDFSVLLIGILPQSVDLYILVI